MNGQELTQGSAVLTYMYPAGFKKNLINGGGIVMCSPYFDTGNDWHYLFSAIGGGTGDACIYLTSMYPARPYGIRPIAIFEK